MRVLFRLPSILGSNGLVGVAMCFSIDCFISIKTLLVAAASSRRCATMAVSSSIDSLD